jgi:hypothetical protein
MTAYSEVAPDLSLQSIKTHVSKLQMLYWYTGMCKGRDALHGQVRVTPNE